MIGASSEIKADAAVFYAIPGEGGGDDGVIMGAGRRAIAITATWQALQRKARQLAQQGGVIQQPDETALNRQRQRSIRGDLLFDVVRKLRMGKPSSCSASMLGAPMLLASAQISWVRQAAAIAFSRPRCSSSRYC